MSTVTGIITIALTGVDVRRRRLMTEATSATGNVKAATCAASEANQGV